MSVRIQTDSQEGMTSALLERRLRRIAWLAVIVLGFIQAWTNRHFINPDGVSYLDVADKYLQRDWTWAVNAYWSPLYSWLLGAALFLLRPSSYWEYPVVHLVNFLVYLGGFACFEFLLFQVIRYQAETVKRSSSDESILPTWAWLAVGYALFLWCALVLITITDVTPDMCVAALVFLAAGILVRVRHRPNKWASFVLLGLVLGFSYLAKAVMFPISLGFLFVCLFSLGDLRKALPRVLVSLIVFLIVGSPFIWALHKSKGRWTFGDNGGFAYAWHVNGTEAYIHWRGEPPGSGIPVRPTRKVFDSPAVYEFREPIPATYSPWYDPSYWCEGTVAHFDLKRQIRVLGESMMGFYAVFINSPIGTAMLVGFLVLQLSSGRRVWSWIAQIKQWNILMPAIAALGLYSLVHIETRYIGAFVVLIWLGLFTGILLSKDSKSTRVGSAVVVAVAALIMTVMVAKSIAPAYSTVSDVFKAKDSAFSEYSHVADGLARRGVKPGDRVGSIAYGFAAGSFWARLAKVRIIAEITSGSNLTPKEDVNIFWHSNAEVKRRVIEAFAKTGAKVIVANRVPAGVSDPGWERIGNTNHYVYFLE